MNVLTNTTKLFIMLNTKRTLLFRFMQRLYPSESSALLGMAVAVGLATGLGIWLYRVGIEVFHELFVVELQHLLGGIFGFLQISAANAELAELQRDAHQVHASGALLDYVALTQAGKLPALSPPRRERADGTLGTTALSLAKYSIVATADRQAFARRTVPSLDERDLEGFSRRIRALAAGRAAADGGAVLLSAPAGPFTVTVFAAPEPVRVGAADLSVLVQSRPDGTPVLDATVSLDLEPPSGPVRALVATRAQATNKLLYATAAVVPVAGPWRLRVSVRRGQDTAGLETAFSVVPERGGLADIWPYLAIPPLAVALFLLRQVRRRR